MKKVFFVVFAACLLISAVVYTMANDVVGTLIPGLPQSINNLTTVLYALFATFASALFSGSATLFVHVIRRFNKDHL